MTVYHGREGKSIPDSEAKTAWIREHTTQVKLKLNNRTDADILHKLDTVPSKQGYIKGLIREDIRQEKEDQSDHQ